ncbi:MAG: ThuA domain-containing protein [Planctomycetota bacterium]
MARCLIFRGGWDGHQPVETVDLIAPRLGDAGLEVDVQDSLDGLDDEQKLRSYNVIVPMWTMGKIPGEASAAITSAVTAGVGLGGWHGGMGDAFREDTGYQFLVGGQFVAHPGDIIDYAVEVTDVDHAITRGLPPRFEVRSEQYYMHVDPFNHVLAETSVVGPGAEWLKGVRMPVAWTRRHGEGRIAYSALGHNMDDFSQEPCLMMAMRCILWAARVLDE